MRGQYWSRFRYGNFHLRSAAELGPTWPSRSHRHWCIPSGRHCASRRHLQVVESLHPPTVVLQAFLPAEKFDRKFNKSVTLTRKETIGCGRKEKEEEHKTSHEAESHHVSRERRGTGILILLVKDHAGVPGTSFLAIQHATYTNLMLFRAGLEMSVASCCLRFPCKEQITHWYLPSPAWAGN